MRTVNGVQVAERQISRCPMAQSACFERVLDHIVRFYPQSDNPQADRERIGQAVKDACGTYVRGKNKGKLKGWASIEYVKVGGWQYLGPGERNGRVLKPGQILSIYINDFTGKTLFFVQS